MPLTSVISMLTLSIPCYHGNIHLSEDCKSLRTTLDAFWCMFLNPVDTIELTDLNPVDTIELSDLNPVDTIGLTDLNFMGIIYVTYCVLHYMEFTNRTFLGARNVECMNTCQVAQGADLSEF